MVLNWGNYLRIPFFVIFFVTGQHWWWFASLRSVWLFQVWGGWYQVIVFWWFFCTISMLKFRMSNKWCRWAVNFVTALDLTKEFGLKLIFLSSDSFLLLFLLSPFDFEYFLKKHSHHLFLLTGFIDNSTELFVSLH